MRWAEEWNGGVKNGTVVKAGRCGWSLELVRIHEFGIPVDGEMRKSFISVDGEMRKSCISACFGQWDGV